MKTLLSSLALLLAVPTMALATGQQVRFALVVHSETASSATATVPATPNFMSLSTTKATYVQWREAIITFANLCRARNLPWQFQSDFNFLEGVRRFEVFGGGSYDSTITNGTYVIDALTGTTSTNTLGKNVVKYLHENLGVNLDPHSHESNPSYNYADVAWLIDVGCDTDVTLVVGGHVYTGTGYQDWPKFVEDRDSNGINDGLLAVSHSGYRWKPHLLMGGGTAAHSADPHVCGLWHPQDASNYFVDLPTGPIAAVGNWEQDFFENNRLLTLLENNTLPHNNKLWTIGRVMNHRDLVQPGYLTTTAPAILDTIAAWRDSGRFQVKTWEDIYTEWMAAPYNGQSSLYQRPVDNISFSLNWQDFCYTNNSNTELRTLLNYHESKQVPVDVFLTTWQTDILESTAPELLGRLLSSRWVNLAYHVRAPKPYADNYGWKTVTSSDISNYENYRLNMVTGEYDTSATGGFGKLTTLYGSAPRLVGPNALLSAKTLLLNYFSGAGVRMIVQHDSSAAVNFGSTTNGLNIRPESYDWKMIEVYNGSAPDGTVPPTTLDGALATARTTSGSVAPYFVGVKLHDNDLFATQSAWTAIYQDSRKVPNWDPYNPTLWASLLTSAVGAGEPDRRRAIYQTIVSDAASRPTTLNLMDGRDTLSMLGEDAVRPVGLTATEVNEEQPVGTVLATLSGGGQASGLLCSYSLTGGTGADDNADFTISGTNLLVARRLDYETHPVRHLRLRWADSAGGSGERALTLVLANVTTDDDDGDGFTEAEEIAAGTDPLNAASRLMVTQTQMTGGNVVLTWASVAGKTYHIEASSNLTTWTTISGSSTTASGLSSSQTVSNGGGSRLFFRVVVD